MTNVLARAEAHAKINLHLGVGAALEDGYHELATVFQTVSLADTITLRSEPQPESTVESQVTGIELVSGPNRAVPLDRTNLIWQAIDVLVMAYQREHGLRELDGVSVQLHKTIPVAGGMAGGSANAAATLVATNHWLSQAYGVAPMGQAELLRHGASLGADVPFTILGGSALGTNRGDELATMMSRGPYHWAMVTNAKGVSTGEVFAKLDEMRADNPDHDILQPHLDTGDVARAMISGDPGQLAQVLHNDLQPATLSLRPDLRAVYESGMSAGALAGIISGSGPTWAFLCASEEEARSVVEQVSLDIGPANGLVVSSPSGGANLLG